MVTVPAPQLHGYALVARASLRAGHEGYAAMGHAVHITDRRSDVDDRTKKQMREAIKFLNSPEAREARRLLSRPEVQEALRHLQSPEAQARLSDLQRPETRRFLEEIRRPEFRRFYEETMRYAREAGAGRAETAIPKFSLPTGFPFGTRLPLDLGANAVRAASEAARTAHAEAFRHSAADLLGGPEPVPGQKLENVQIPIRQAPPPLRLHP